MKKEALRGQIYSNWEQMIEEVREFLASPTPRMLLVGEFQDGLAFDHAYVGVTGKPLTHHLIPLLRCPEAAPSDLPNQEHPHQTCNQARTDTAGRFLLVGKCRVRWPQMGERGSLPSSRFTAAARMREAGWPIRVRLDPMIPYRDDSEGWQGGYEVAVDQINRLSPEMVTIGALRASSMGLATAAGKNGRPTDLFDYLSEKDPSGF